MRRGCGRSSDRAKGTVRAERFPMTGQVLHPNGGEVVNT